MSGELHPKLTVGDLTLIGNYWFQLSSEEEAIVEIPPLPLRLVFVLEDFEGDEKPELEVLPTDDDYTARWVFRHSKSLGSVGMFGTTRPIVAGWMGDLEIWISHSLRVFRDTVLLSLAIYSKPREKDEDDVG